MSRKPVPSGLVDVTEGEDAGERETPVSGPGQMRHRTQDAKPTKSSDGDHKTCLTSIHGKDHPIYSEMPHRILEISWQDLGGWHKEGQSIHPHLKASDEPQPASVRSSSVNL